jgi:hypothetical protein
MVFNLVFMLLLQHEFKILCTMDYISTKSLANERDINPTDLFEKLKSLKWIERKDNKWVLTVLGKNKGGQMRTSPKFGEFIVWPDNISFETQDQHFVKQKLLNATALGKHFNISSQRSNLILSELGWIEKALVGQDVNGWAVTKLGKSLGGRQFEHETSGGSYVLWPDSILQNKSLQEVFSFNHIEKEHITPHPSQQLQQPTHQTSTDYREKYEAKHRALDGHYVRSRAEVIIDNHLYQYGLVHAYERKIIIDDQEVLSDFYIPAGKVYIEFWGMEGDPKYAERKKKKIEFYKKNEIRLIELNDNDIFNLDDHLPRKLKDFGIKVY